ncbi:MAG: hypothetical protein ACREIU_15040 [Planctomycetota bacterium]
MPIVRVGSKVSSGIPVLLLLAVVGTGCAGVKEASPAIVECLRVDREASAPWGDPWTFSGMSDPRWYPRIISPPPRSWPTVGAGSEEPAAVELREEGTLGETIEASVRQVHWRSLNQRRPRIVGSGGSGGDGRKELLEIELPEAEAVGSIALVSVDALLGSAEAGRGVVRVAFTEVSSRGLLSSGRSVRIEFERPPLRPGNYALVVTTASGAPSVGEFLLAVEGSSRAKADGFQGMKGEGTSPAPASPPTDPGPR